MSKAERQSRYLAKFREVQGYRLIIEWQYRDTDDLITITIPKDTFITQPFTNGPFRSASFLGRDLLVPRALLRRAKTLCPKDRADDLIIGKIHPPKTVHEKLRPKKL